MAQAEVVATKFHLLWMPCLGGTRIISTNSTSRGSGYENMDVCDFEGMHCSNILGTKSRGACGQGAEVAFGSAVRGSSHTQRPTFWISRSTMAFAAWIQKSAQNQNAAVRSWHSGNSGTVELFGLKMELIEMASDSCKAMLWTLACNHRDSIVLACAA